LRPDRKEKEGWAALVGIEMDRAAEIPGHIGKAGMTAKLVVIPA